MKEQDLITRVIDCLEVMTDRQNTILALIDNLADSAIDPDEFRRLRLDVEAIERRTREGQG
jgi:hypothetical protein